MGADWGAQTVGSGYTKLLILLEFTPISMIAKMAEKG